MEHLSQEERDALSQQRFNAIPFELVDDAHEYAVSFDDNCIEALFRKIYAKKRVYYLNRD